MPNLPKSDYYAFPIHAEIREGDVTTFWTNAGMTLREYYAAAALPAVMARGASRLTPEAYAKEAFALADAMMKASQG